MDETGHGEAARGGHDHQPGQHGPRRPPPPDPHTDSYRPVLSTSPVSPEDIRAAAAVHEELGPDYSDAVVASFLDKVDREVAARVEARLAGTPHARPAQRGSRRVPWTGITIAAALSGIPLILLTLAHPQMVRHMTAAARGPGGTVTRVVVQSAAAHGPAAVRAGWLLLWLVVVAICAATAVRARRHTASRGPRS